MSTVVSRLTLSVENKGAPLVANISSSGSDVLNSSGNINASLVVPKSESHSKSDASDDSVGPRPSNQS